MLYRSKGIKCRNMHMNTRVRTSQDCVSPSDHHWVICKKCLLEMFCPQASVEPVDPSSGAALLLCTVLLPSYSQTTVIVFYPLLYTLELWGWDINSIWSMCHLYLRWEKRQMVLYPTCLKQASQAYCSSNMFFSIKLKISNS